jgi:hypothetical protein
MGYPDEGCPGGFGWKPAPARKRYAVRITEDEHRWEKAAERSRGQCVADTDAMQPYGSINLSAGW